MTREGIGTFFLNVNPKNNPGASALSTICTIRHKARAKLLCERRADLHVRNKDGQTALHSAPWEGQIAIVKLLLK